MLRYGILAAVLLFSFAVPVSAKEVPVTGMISGMGVNIHFTGDQSMDLDMIREGGFKVVRMDLAWSAVERTKGKYDFSQYDALTRGLMSRGIRPLYILDYGNSLYNDGKGTMNTEKERDAFTKFAKAAVSRYKGKGIVYELWNEPNGSGFWKNPNPTDYMKLAEKVLPVLRQADPNATLIGPGVSGVDLRYLEGCFSRGLLKMVDAVSVHPYRQNNPETAESEILALRGLIAEYNPSKPDIPVISSEWGYSTGWSGLTDELQGMYLARQQLLNLSLGIPISIWYDWHDDGQDPEEPEHHFGSVDYWYGNKPAYDAAKELYGALDVFRFIKRLEKQSQNDYVLIFAKGAKKLIAAWTTAAGHDIELYPGKTLTLTGKPQYVEVPAGIVGLEAESSWSVTPKVQAVAGGRALSDKIYPAFTVSVKNPYNKRADVELDVTPPVGVEGSLGESGKVTLSPGGTKEFQWTGKLLRRDCDKIRILINVTIDGQVSRQTLTFIVVDPISITLAPLREGKLALIAGGIGEELNGAEFTEPVRFIPQSDASLFPSGALNEGQVLIPMPSEYRIGSEPAKITLADSRGIQIYSSEYKIVPLNIAKARVNAVNSGDQKINPKYSLSEAAHGVDGVPLDTGLVLSYGFKEGWNFIEIKPKSTIRIDGTPKAIGMWVKGNGSGIPLRMRFVDKNGRTFQPAFPDPNFTGWRFLTAPLNDPNVGTWGGKSTETDIKYPIRIETLILLDGSNTTLKGDMEFAGCVLLY